jgi:hypothetical protein
VPEALDAKKLSSNSFVNSVVNFYELLEAKSLEEDGAGDGIRTRDVLLGRQALCH